MLFGLGGPQARGAGRMPADIYAGKMPACRQNAGAHLELAKMSREPPGCHTSCQRYKPIPEVRYDSELPEDLQ